MDNTDLSRGGGIKNYNLPERQSKIDCILKMQNEGPLYCICRSTYSDNSFMIQCEKCEEWFHGDCIGLEQKACSSIKKWFCFMCIKHYGLQIEFRKSKKSNRKKQKVSSKMSTEDGLSVVDRRMDSYCENRTNCLPNEERGNGNYSNLNLSTNYKNQITNQEQAAQAELTQCYKTSCCKTRRSSSKYCSEECGLALGRERMMTILPQRIIEWEKTPCRLEQLDKANLDFIRIQLRLSTEKLKIFDAKEMELCGMIERAKKTPIIDDVIEYEDTKMSCITCGIEIPLQSARKHLELCFKRNEGKIILIGKCKGNTDTCQIFCDFFDAKNKTYCKHLRYICPDHFKATKTPKNEVCGCPIAEKITTNMVFNSKTFCQQAKLKCDKHYNWEFLTMSEIDFDRLKEINKINQLGAEEANIVQRFKDRRGALGLLLHSTKIE